MLANPGAVAALRQAIARYVVIDPGWNLTGLVQQVQSMSEGSIEFRTIPTGRIDLPTPDGDAVQVDPVQVQQFVAGLTDPGGQPFSPASPTAPAVAPMATSLPCVS